MSHRSYRQATRTCILSTIFMAAAITCWQPGVLAQSLYRCGNVYQDQPCTGGQKEKRIGVAANSAAAQDSNADASCTQRGADALKIVWRREAGLTLEQAASQAGSPSEKALVGEVYRVRGTAPEVRARIESECMSEKERRERYAASAPNAPTVGDPAAAVPARKPGSNSAGAPAATLNAERKPPKNNSECQQLTARLERIRAQQRAGGDAGRMEQLRTDLTEAQKQSRQQNCS